jgi:U3 small nucleolar RNA-associated protein 18
LDPEIISRKLSSICADDNHTSKQLSMAPLSTSRGSKVAVKEREVSFSDEEEFQGLQGDDVDGSDKDSTEEELERLVFGDSSGFRDGLRSFAQADQIGKGKELVLAEEDVEDGQTGLENVDDADVCCIALMPTKTLY